MVKIDLKDRKILYELDLNSRQSFSKIGKKIGLPKTVVAYRIKRLQENGIIKNFYPVIDAYKLGYISVRIYLTFQYTTPKIENEILDYFIKNKLTYWIGSIEGKYDLVAIMWIKELYEFHLFWKKTLTKFRDYFQIESFSIYIQLIHFPNSYLLDKTSETKRKSIEVIGSIKKVQIDKNDFMILNELSRNARIASKEIAKKTNLSIATVNNRIKNLIKKGVIQGFRTNIDISKIDIMQFKVDINFRDYGRINSVIEYVKENPHLIYITITAGHADLELSFRLSSVSQVKKIMNDIYGKFPNVIRNYNYFIITKIHKLNYMPEK